MRFCTYQRSHIQEKDDVLFPPYCNRPNKVTNLIEIEDRDVKDYPLLRFVY